LVRRTRDRRLVVPLIEATGLARPSITFGTPTPSSSRRNQLGSVGRARSHICGHEMSLTHTICPRPSHISCMCPLQHPEHLPSNHTIPLTSSPLWLPILLPSGSNCCPLDTTSIPPDSVGGVQLLHLSLAASSSCSRTHVLV
jgi:hypothetical protein